MFQSSPIQYDVSMLSRNIFDGALKMVALVAFSLTMSACQNNPRAPSPTLSQPALAPGTIKLMVKVDICTKRKVEVRPTSVFDCETSVLSVQEYGASTTQLPESTKIRISIRESMLVDGASVMLESGKELALLIRATRDTNPDNSNPDWETIQIF